MKYKPFYSPFFIFFFLIWMVSCNQNKGATSKESKEVALKINHLLQQAKADSLSTSQKLVYINKSCTLAQKANIDSLILKTSNKKAQFYNSHYPDSAYVVLKNFEKLANSKKDTLYNAHSLLNLGEYYFQLKQKNTAFNYFNKANLEFKNCKDSSNVVYSYLMMAMILNEKSNYFDMEAVNTEALKYISPTDKNYKSNYICVYNNLGIALRQTLDFEKSLFYYKKARQYAETPFNKITLENNIAAVYTHNNQPQKALDILLPLDQIKSEAKTPKLNTLISNNIGLAYLKQKNPKSLGYFLKALSLAKAIDNNQSLIDCYSHLANYYKNDRKTIPLANQYAQKSYALATKMGVTEERLKSLELLSITSNGQESNDYLKSYFKLNDSLIAVKQRNKNQFAKMRYDFSSQMEQNQVLKIQESEKNLRLAQFENQILLLIILVVIGMGGTIFGYNYLKQKSKKEILQEGYNTETRISKQLHDELANDVYHAMTFAETQNLIDENNKETLLHNLDIIYNRTRNISKENSAIETGPLFESHLKEMIADFSSYQVNILINGIESIPFSSIESNKKIILFRVLQELLVNMKKHSQCSIVAISFKKSAHNLQIEYSDNGIGMEPNTKIIKNGLQNVENRIDSIKGTINFDSTSGKGFKVSLSFPI